MGLSPFGNCRTNYAVTSVPNPDPSRWELLDRKQFPEAYVLKVRYLDCTNYEGVKLLVFKGQYKEREYLDPHFSEDKDSPIARFRPDKEGRRLAFTLAGSIGKPGWKGAVLRTYFEDETCAEHIADFYDEEAYGQVAEELKKIARKDNKLLTESLEVQ